MALCVFNRPAVQTLEFLTKLKTKVVSANRISKFDEKGLEGKVKKNFSLDNDLDVSLMDSEGGMKL